MSLAADSLAYVDGRFICETVGYALKVSTAFSIKFNIIGTLIA